MPAAPCAVQRLIDSERGASRRSSAKSGYSEVEMDPIEEVGSAGRQARMMKDCCGCQRCKEVPVLPVWLSQCMHSTTSACWPIALDMCPS
jgi:hypothetical protein